MWALGASSPKMRRQLLGGVNPLTPEQIQIQNALDQSDQERRSSHRKLKALENWFANSGMWQRAGPAGVYLGLPACSLANQ
jgi:hypothetical protein